LDLPTLIGVRSLVSPVIQPNTIRRASIALLGVGELTDYRAHEEDFLTAMVPVPELDTH